MKHPIRYLCHRFDLDVVDAWFLVVLWSFMAVMVAAATVVHGRVALGAAVGATVGGWFALMAVQGASHVRRARDLRDAGRCPTCGAAGRNQIGAPMPAPPPEEVL